MTEKVNFQSLYFDFLMYSLNTFVFLIGTVIYSMSIENGGLKEILDSFVNGTSPYWIFGLTFLYLIIAILIYLLSLIIGKIKFKKVLTHIKDYVLSSFSNLGSSLSGIMFATTIFVFRSDNLEVNTMKGAYLLLSIVCFVLFFGGTSLFKWLIYRNSQLEAEAIS